MCRFWLYKVPLTIDALQDSSAAVYGIDANIIQVEVDCSGIKTDQDHFHTVGLPDAAVRESRDRVRAALKNCGYDIPPTHITINLAPADIKKEGSGFDLPMALGIVGAYGGLTRKEIDDCLFVGELSLDGGVRGIRGTLPIALEARSRKISRLVVPEANAREAAMVGGVDVYPVRSLLDVIHFVNSGNGIAPLKADGDALLREKSRSFWSISKMCAGSKRRSAPSKSPCWRPQHNNDWAARLGKNHAGQAMPSILPPLTFEEALETTKIHSVAGVLDPRQRLGRQTAVSLASSYDFGRRADWRRRRFPAPARSRYPTTDCCSSMSFPSFPATCWKCCGSLWKMGRSRFPVRRCRLCFPRASCWLRP